MHIAFVTSAAHRDLTPDDHLAVTALERRGAQVTGTVWNDQSVDWGRFDAIIVRSTWDYHSHSQDFRAWIDMLDAMSAPVWNPPEMLRWNMQKTYLRDLERAGVPVIPTEWLTKGALPDLGALLEKRGWSDAVVKPVISAAANRTWRISRRIDPKSVEQIAESLAIGDVMVQPFIPEIQTHGEWSLIFIDGDFSHAVRKTPSEGDFRVQAHLGGEAATEDPGANVISIARRVLGAVPSEWLYARVDGIETKTGFVLLELEMLEPSLYFLHTESGPVRFAEAIIARAKRRR